MVSVWELNSGSHLFDLSTEHSTTTHCTSMADGGNLAFTGSDDFCIRIWDLKSPPVAQSNKYHDSDTLAVTISPCGMYAISGGVDSSVKVYDLESMKVLKELHGHKGGINDVKVMRDSKHLLSASSDGSVRMWNGETEEVVRTFCDTKVSSQVNCIAISADSELLMSGNEDGQVMFWSIKTEKLLKIFTNHKSAVVSVAFAQSLTSVYIISASRDGQVCARDFHTATVLLSKQTHTDDLLCMDVSRDASTYATGAKEGECHVVSLPSGSLKSVLTGNKGSVRSVKLLRTGRLCLTASEDCTLRLWDVTQSECIAMLHADLPILSCDIDRHEAHILYGTKDGWVTTALYCDKATGDSIQHNSMMKKLKGINSPSSSSFTETDSSQSSKVMNTEKELALVQQSPSVNMLDASSIPLPPSDDEGSSLENKSTQSQTLSIIHDQLLEETKDDTEADQDTPSPMPNINTTTTDVSDGNELLSMQATTVCGDSTEQDAEHLFKKLIPDISGFIEFKPDTSELQIKSDMTGNGQESVHNINLVEEEETMSESHKSKTSLPTSSSFCALL